MLSPAAKRIIALLHMNTTGDLTLHTPSLSVSPDNNDDVKNNSSSKLRKPDLLDELSYRTEAYRDIKIPSKLSVLKDFEQRICFDTINLRYNNDEDESDDTYGGSGAGIGSDLPRGRSRGRSPSPSPAHISPLQSPNNMNQALLSVGGGDAFSAIAARMLSPFSPEYPTTPLLTHNGCTFTKFHNDFDNLYQGKLNNKEHGFLKPLLKNRVILVYISGRKHTWVALDWILNQFVENGDTIIVCSAINKGFDPSSRKKFLEATKITPRYRLRQRHRPENVKLIAKQIMDYMLCVVKPGAIVKLSVDLCVGHTKSVLKDMFKLYEPNIVSTGTKTPNSRIGAPLKSWHSSKLTDRLVKNFPLPLIAVPAVNMDLFEQELEFSAQPQCKWFEKDVRESQAEEEKPKESDVVSDDASVVSDEVGSIDSLDSAESYSSFVEISQLYTSYRKNLKQKLEVDCHRKIDENYFSQFLKTISDNSIEFCQNVRDVDPDFKGRGAKLARAITGSNTFGSVPYKTKSLLAPVEKPSPMTPNSTSSTSGALSYKELKRLATHKNESSQTPQITIESPNQSTIKFGKLESPPNRNTSGMSSKKLQKSLSHELERQFRPSLAPSKSQPDIVGGYLASDDDSKKKSKSKKFWKLFK